MGRLNSWWTHVDDTGQERRPPLPTNSVLGRSIRTFKPRRSRITKSQQHAIDNPLDLLIEYAPEPLATINDWPPTETKLFIDIGFGNGITTLDLARKDPCNSYLAIDVHTPGVGDLLHEIQVHGMTNIRVMESDAIAVLENMIEPESVSGVFTLFPDPWPKARHHKRRIVQPSIMHLIHSRLVPGGFWQLATDWQEYAESISEQFEAQQDSWSGGITSRPERPLTHYEQRALTEYRTITDFSFIRR